jgi:hypothetical protein
MDGHPCYHFPAGNFRRFGKEYGKIQAVLRLLVFSIKLREKEKRQNIAGLWSSQKGVNRAIRKPA